MRTITLIGAALLACACTQQPQSEASSPDMGPMPIVAALYDWGPAPTEQDQLSISFTNEMSAAIAAKAATPDGLDFDYRSWAIDPEVEDIRYAVGQHGDANHAEIVTRFGYEGLPGGMHLTWNMCRRADGAWRIEDIRAIAVGDEANPGAGEEVSLRPMIGLPAEAADTCV